MTWSDAERLKVRLYTGWSDRFLQDDGALERALNSVEGRTETETLVRSIVAQCEALDTEIVDSRLRYQASKVGDLTLNAREQEQLRSTGRQLSGRLCQIFGVEGRHDPWRGRTPRGRAGRRGTYLAQG